jgi:hypothetical protein
LHGGLAASDPVDLLAHPAQFLGQSIDLSHAGVNRGASRRGQRRRGNAFPASRRHRLDVEIHGAQVIETGLHPLQPAGALIEHVLVEPNQCPSLQHRFWGNPRLRNPTFQQQIPQQLGVGAIGLGPAFRASSRRCLGRLGDMGLDARALELLNDITPTCAALQRERHTAVVGEPLQPSAQREPIPWRDPTPEHLPRVEIYIVKCQLGSMNIDSTHH